MSKNGGFEDATAVSAKGWYAYGGAKGSLTGEYVQLETVNVRTGSNAVAIKSFNQGSDIYPWISYEIPDIVPGATYQVVTRFKMPGPEKGIIGITCEYNGASKPDASQWLSIRHKGNYTGGISNEWKEIVFNTEAPENALSCLVRLRLFSDDVTTTVYFDDVEMYMISAPDMISLTTDEVFYYTEWVYGEATAKILHNADYVKECNVSFSVLDGDMVLKNETAPFNGSEAKFRYETELFKEIGKEYTVSASLIDKEGNKVFSLSEPVYRYNRPTYLRADGVFVKNGKETNIILGNGTTPKVMPHAPEAGVTVAQLVGGNESSILEKLDLAQSLGMYGMVNFYNDTENAASPGRLQSTIEIVKLVRNHPALYGYKVQDEPFGKGNSTDELRLAYKTIRDLDPHHPIYLDDSGFGIFEEMGKYCDIMDIDTYPANTPNRATYISDMMELAVKAVDGRKPVTLLQQAFEWFGYLPPADSLRHFAYQALFSGASGFGYHSIGQDNAAAPPFYETASWPGVCEFALWEQQLAFDHFINGKYPLFNEARESNAWWRTFVAGNDLYAIILNRSETSGTEVSIKLSSYDNAVSVGDFTARRVAGGSDITVSDSGILNVALDPIEAALYRITPSSLTDFSSIKGSKYRDLYGYSWARSAITHLEEKNIINGVSEYWYGPGQNITRGDFAMFLVRTLGLASDSTGNFADVSKSREYAKELAIGKALGILSGVGDNRFNPEAEISRQDMMTMTARALNLQAGEINSAAYSDWGSISDYAVSSVSAMVASGIIKGNADGTINPQGKTTRAEAAVIMDRILSRVKGTQ